MTTPPESAPASAAPPVPGPATPAVGSAVPASSEVPTPSGGDAPNGAGASGVTPFGVTGPDGVAGPDGLPVPAGPAGAPEGAVAAASGTQSAPGTPSAGGTSSTAGAPSAADASGASAVVPVQPGPVQPAPVGPPIPAFGLPPTQPAPPTYDPTPVMQAMPISALYVPVPTQPTQSGGSKVAVTILSMLLGLFVLASGTLAVLYVRQGQESTRKSEQIAALEATAAEVQRELDATDRNLRRADEDLADLRAERDALAGCLTAIFNFFDAVAAAEGAETPQTQAAELEVSSACREAERYL